MCARVGAWILTSRSDGNIRYFEYQNDKFEYLSEYKSGEPQRGMAFLPRRGINVHENEVMRAYKTVNDSYIEPISFTVPRRAETFQSDIYPPAVGLKPAMSALEWLEGKTGLPPKIDLESIYEGNAPVEVPSDYKPPAAAAPPAASKLATKKEPEPEPPKPAPVAARAPPAVSDQKASLSAMANKYQETEESSDEDDAETSSFEEITKPVVRAATAVQNKATTAAASVVPAIKAAVPAVASPASPVKPKSPKVTPTSQPTASVSKPPAAAGSALECSLEQIRQLLEKQTQILSEQNDKISQLTSEVEVLKKRVGTGSAAAQDQSERIRQLELELEAARS